MKNTKLSLVLMGLVAFIPLASQAKFAEGCKELLNGKDSHGDYLYWKNSKELRDAKIVNKVVRDFYLRSFMLDHVAKNDFATECQNEVKDLEELHKKGWLTDYRGSSSRECLKFLNDEELGCNKGLRDSYVKNRVTQISSGTAHSCVVLDGGKVKCWGFGKDGRLGYGNEENVGNRAENLPSTKSFVDLGPNTVAISVVTGESHTCALLDDGGVMCWGYGAEGQLGYGNKENIGDQPDKLPSSKGKVPLGRKAVALAAGGNHTCVLTEEGDVTCWGENDSNQIGLRNITRYAGNTPETLPEKNAFVDLGGKAKAIAVGNRHSCAILENGKAKCWGKVYWDLPSFTPATSFAPSPVPDIENAVGISAGYSNTCFLLKGGKVRCLGESGAILGLGGSKNAKEIALGSPAVSISVGMEHVCAVLSGGKLMCWGGRSELSTQFLFGAVLGYGEKGPKAFVGLTNTPASKGTVPLTEAVRHVSASTSTCVLLKIGKVKCWGDDNGMLGVLGYGDTKSRGNTPETIPDNIEEVPIN